MEKFTSFLKFMALGLLCLVLASLFSLLIDIQHRLDDWVPHVESESKDIASRLDKTDSYLNSVLAEFTLTTKQERTYWDKSQGQVDAALTKANLFIDHLEANINTGVLPAATALLKQATTSTSTITDSANATLASVTVEVGHIDPVLTNSAAMALQTSKLLQSQDIQDTLHNLSSTTASGVVIAHNVEGITNDAHATSTDLANMVHRETRPLTATYKLGMLAIERVGSIFAFLRSIL